MFSRIIPSWKQIEEFKQPLTEGERCLLEFLDNNLIKDDLFIDGDLTKYNGWLIFVQPFLNGSRPDIIILNPNIGAQIFEVKDWNLSNYSFEIKKGCDSNNHKVFCFSDSAGIYPIKSPTKQVTYYKEKIVSQLIPQMGENIDKNIKTYGLIKTAIYFHKSTTEQAVNLFRDEIKDFLKCPVIGRDMLLAKNIDKIVPDYYIKKSVYWNKDWNKELIFWLYPPQHTLEQCTRLNLIDEQKKFAEPQPGHYRIRGVAGSGKTQVLAYRASKLASEGYRVLVLTYNITLWHYIRDMVQRSPFEFSWKNLTITYFHGFCKDILNEFGERWPIENDDSENIFREVIVKKISEVIGKHNYEKFDAILIDEGQDFYVEWYQMLRQFLTGRDEVVIVSDEKQNVYGRDNSWIRRNRDDMKQFGEWINLKKIIRLPEKIARISIDFAEKYNLNQDIKIGIIIKADLFNQSIDNLIWWNVDENEWLTKVDEAYEILKNNAVHKHPSDTVILLPDKNFGLDCADYFKLKKNVLVNHVFEDEEEKKYHKHKKAFWMGDSRLKMSTIYSFKGFEVPNVILVIPPVMRNTQELGNCLIYTAMTRARENLIIINLNKLYNEFGKSYSNKWK